MKFFNLGIQFFELCKDLWIFYWGWNFSCFFNFKTWMIVFFNLGLFLNGNSGVILDNIQTFPANDFLNLTNINTCFKQMNCAGSTKIMRGNLLF